MTKSPGAERINAMAECYLAGEKLVDIGKKFGISANNVAVTMKHYGFRRRKPTISDELREVHKGVTVEDKKSPASMSSLRIDVHDLEALSELANNLNTSLSEALRYAVNKALESRW